MLSFLSLVVTKVKRRSCGRELLIISGILAAAGAAYYYSAPVVEVPFTGRKYRRLIPKEVTNWVELTIVEELLAENEDDILPEDHPLVRQITSIGNVLTDANGLPRHDYILVDSEEVNAFVVGGNTVFVYTGILPILQNVSGAAMVLGHEMGHVLAGHPVEGMAQALGTIALSLCLSIFGAGNELAMDLFDLVFRLPKERDAELEADAIGYALMSRAGFDREEAVNVYERMMVATGEDEQGEWDDWDQTHPIWATRIGLLEELIDTDPSPSTKWVRLPAVPPMSVDDAAGEDDEDEDAYYVLEDEDEDDEDEDVDEDGGQDEAASEKRSYSPYNIFGRVGAERASLSHKRLKKRVRAAQRKNKKLDKHNEKPPMPLLAEHAKSSSLTAYTVVGRIGVDRAKAIRQRVRDRIRLAQQRNL